MSTEPRSTPASPLTGSSEVFRAFVARLEQVAATDVTVLVTGESGSGKGVAARAIHDRSARRDGPYVAVNLAAIPASLVESELFGHDRGAFTGAERSRSGCFRRADGGTLVLDDVGLLPAEAQVKLLRVLQERQVEPLGADGPVSVDVRLVSTSGVDLQEKVQEDAFREDLYYRLAVVPLEVPPLRVRIGDLEELVRDLSVSVEARIGRPARTLSAAALERLAGHPFPGNVRELENALERVSVLPPVPAGDPPGEVGPEELDFLGESVRGMADELARRALAHGIDPEALTRAMMTRALEDHRGNVSAAARAVGLTRRAFEYRLERMGDESPEEAP